MGAAGLLFDLLLAIALIWLGWQATRAADLYRAVISFIVFGLLMALAWVRLEAPDIALAEAAIGAGATGALLLSALDRLAVYREGQVPGHAPARSWGFWIPAGSGILGLLTLAAWYLPAPGMGGLAIDALPQAGVDHPVTAVLLNFRALDTLFEIAILLLAAIAMWSLGPAHVPSAPSIPSPSLPALARILFPVFLLMTAYLLWRGSHAPGGAFPAGAVLGAGGILMVLAGSGPWIHSDPRGPWRLALSIGVVAMLAVAIAGMATGYGYLEYPQQSAVWAIPLIEVAAGSSIALLLVALYLRGRPRRVGDKYREESC